MKIFLFSILLFAYNLSFAQETKVDLDKFINETQISSSKSDEMRIIWWIPVEFWKFTFENEQSFSKKQVEEFVDVLKPYTIFAIIDGKIGPFGGITYTQLDSISKNLALVDNNNIGNAQLDFEELNSDVQILLSSMKPILKNMLGPMGENMHFFVFSDITKKKERVADPYAKGYVKLHALGAEYKWRTPIGALLPLKVCPEDNEKMNGAWDYCPWHGALLESTKE